MIWSVVNADGFAENVEAESVFINGASTLLFLNKAVVAAPVVTPEVEGEPAKKPAKKKWTPKPQTVTVRAFNFGAWRDVRLIG